MAAQHEVDVVAMPSLKTDGTPDQGTGYKVLDEKGAAKAASNFDEFRDKTQETVEAPAGTDEADTKATPKK